MASIKSAAALFGLMFWAAIAASPTVHAGGASQGTSAAAPNQLTNDSLRQMLDGMGLEPKALSKGYLIVIKRDTWTYNMQLVLSENQEKLGFNANLGIVENPDAVTAAQWKALMISNGDIEPSFFYFDAKTKKLYLHRVLDNRAITPAFLRGQIENFVGNMKSTADLWKFTK
ncbi:MAG: hypothetical protein LAO20_19905 [Acidobacteriia bacterium]|nr:hypothetical protein [Terriglobia bacterium]